ncbi:MAG: respiratory nitrate reductase subunit gamma [Cyanobacteria bacterium]|nr:respiratory nitrate reductase subunit gamma [Cyanobacteriota bacterium]
MTVHTLLFGYFPFIAAIIFVAGNLLRLRRDLVSWRSGTAEPCHIYRLSPLSKLFHVGIFVLLFGHIAGLLVPPSIYQSMGISASAKQLFAAVTGGGFGVLSFFGLAYYLHHRLTCPEKRATGTSMDVFVLLFIGAELLLGLATVPLSLAHSDGSQMLIFAEWAQRILLFQADAGNLLVEVSWLFKLHILLGIGFFILIPFSHLVHMWTVPLRMLLYPDQVTIER